MTDASSYPADPQAASRSFHRMLIRLMIYLNRDVETNQAWQNVPKEPSFPQFRTLIMLHQIGPCTLKALAEALGISAASASEMIERLVEMKFVDRSQDSADRRCVKVELTSLAVQGVERHEAMILVRLEQLMEALGPRQTQRGVELAERISDAMIKTEQHHKTRRTSAIAGDSTDHLEE